MEGSTLFRNYTGGRGIVITKKSEVSYRKEASVPVKWQCNEIPGSVCSTHTVISTNLVMIKIEK